MAMEIKTLKINVIRTPHPSSVMILVQICLYCLNCTKFG